MIQRDYRYSVCEAAEYIHWLYFFHAWGFPPRFAAVAEFHGCDTCCSSWLASFSGKERARATEAMQLYKEAVKMLFTMDAKGFYTHARCRLYEAGSEEDDLIFFLGEESRNENEILRFPLLRQQTSKQTDEPYLCLSDFVRPITSGKPDCVGVFAAAVEADVESFYADDPYQHLLVQTLADRLAEASVERMHRDVRTRFWGYACTEELTISQMHREEFQGIRPAVGYPSLPDQSVNFLIDRLLDLKDLGISLTENGAMIPHASVSGLMLAHPQARYFSVGAITDEQFADYAYRRGISVNEIRKFFIPYISAYPKL